MQSLESIYHERNDTDARNVTLAENAHEPPDGGWGWIVAAGGCITCVLLLMPLGVFGIIYSDILMKNDVSTSTITWIFNLDYFIWSFCAILADPLCSQFGFRKVAVTGGLIGSLSIILSGFATKPYHLFFCFSLMHGFSLAITVPVCDFILTHYFKKFLGTAFGVYMTSGGFSAFLSPIIVTKFQEEFSANGAIFLVGALMLNIIVAASLFHPVEWHVKPKKKKKRNNEEEEEQKEQNLLPPVPEEVSSSNKLLNHNQNVGIHQSGQLRVRKLTERSNYSFGSIGSSIPNIVLLERDEKSLTLNNEKKYKDVRHKRMLSMGYQIIRVLKGSFGNLTLIKSHRVKLISAGMALLLTVYVNSIMFIPFIIKERGYSLDDASWVLSSAAASNVLARIVISIMVDKFNLSSRTYFMFGTMCVSVALFALSIVDDLLFIKILGVIFGIGAGSCIVLVTLVNIEFMGMEYLPQAYGVSSITYGFAVITIGPIIGLIRDVSGSYNLIMKVLSAISCFSFLLYSIIPLAVKSDIERNCAQLTNKNPSKEEDSDCLSV